MLAKSSGNLEAALGEDYEVMSATIGLGFSLQSGRDMADINQVGMVMIVIIILGIVIDRFVFSTIENKMLRKRGMSL